MGEITVGSKVWLEYNGRPLIGMGRYNLLRKIDETKSLKDSATAVGLSYKTAYNYIKKIEKRLGSRIILSKKGGKDAGGMTALNENGKMLVKEFESIR
jgi:molybdate transport system regulatory protein